MIASMRRVTRKAILFHGWVLPEERSPLIGMADIAELVYAVFPDHLPTKGAVLVMTLRAFEKSFPQRVAGLPHLLRPDVPMTGVAQLGLPCFQILPDPGMSPVAIRARNPVDPVAAEVPEGNNP